MLLFVSIYAMNSDIPGSPWFVVARVFFGTFIVKLLPPGHLSAFPYSGHFILVALIPYSKSCSLSFLEYYYKSSG